jgi:hypothetical protein
MNGMPGRRCANCKHFLRGPQFNECHRYPPDPKPLLLGVGPPTAQYPNGTPVVHLDVRFAVVDPNYWCGEWHMALEIAHSLDDSVVSLLPGNGSAQ